MARPTALTEKVYAAILTSIRGGSTLQAAAAAAGVAEDTVQEWLARGRGTSSKRTSTTLYARFAREVARAKDEAVHTALSGVFAAGSKDARYYLEWLKLMYPRQYGARRSMELGEMLEAARRVAAEHGLPEDMAYDVLQRANEVAQAAGAGALRGASNGGAHGD